MTHFYRNGSKVTVAYDRATAYVHDTEQVIFNPIVDIATGQVYETGEEYLRAKTLEAAARKSETIPC